MSFYFLPKEVAKRECVKKQVSPPKKRTISGKSNNRHIFDKNESYLKFFFVCLLFFKYGI